MIKKRLVAATAMATLAPSPWPRVAAAGRTTRGAKAPPRDVDLTVLDYYNDEPGKSNVGAQLKKCGTSIGVATVDHQSVPGHLIQKVLQQASSKTLPDMLMLDNPDIQQIAEAGALMPLGDFGINAEDMHPVRYPRPPTTASCTVCSPAPTPWPSFTTRTCWPRPACSPQRPGPS